MESFQPSVSLLRLGPALIVVLNKPCDAVIIVPATQCPGTEVDGRTPAKTFTTVIGDEPVSQVLDRRNLVLPVHAGHHSLKPSFCIDGSRPGVVFPSGLDNKDCGMLCTSCKSRCGGCACWTRAEDDEIHSVTRSRVHGIEMVGIFMVQCIRVAVSI